MGITNELRPYTHIGFSKTYRKKILGKEPYWSPFYN